ncbi:TPM domain-containing protein [Bacteriovoracaceae bacterium]|nr:TPM domain-containing protein [Bacteriovoracaceae bacterium]|tara:strand:- start:4192 stop:4917 length:726 start_codon:yes stop_codon:yes gene_type:complete
MRKVKYTDIDKKRIEEAISLVEARTDAEVIPIIFRKSDNYPGAHLRCAILFGMLIPAIIYMIPIDFDRPELYVYGQITGLLLGYVLTFNDRMKRLFCTFGEMKEEVYQRCTQAFLENGLHTTKDNTGILIAISLLEHKVEIMADYGINQKVNKNTWKEICQGLTKKIKSGDINGGIVEAINECGKHLIEHFPKTEDNQNELSNQLVIDGIKKKEETKPIETMDSSEDPSAENNQEETNSEH